MALEQSWRGVKQERQKHAIGLGQGERVFGGTLRDGPVAEPIARSRLQQESLRHPGAQAHRRGGAADDRTERSGRRLRIVLGEPQRRKGGADLGGFALVSVQFGESLFGALYFTAPHQGG